MSSGSLSAATPETGGGRAFRPGPRKAFGAAALAAAAIAAILLVALGSSGGNAPTAQRAATKYGRLPAWLPRISNSTPKLEVARPSAPVLSEEQGYTVHAVLPGGSTDITAVGPQVPGYVADDVQSGTWPDDKPVPGTFIVTLADVSGDVPLSAGAFSILTDSGRIVHPRVTVRGGGRLPSMLHAGQHLNLEVTGGVTEGSGSIRWAPLGPKVLVGWIYQLELD
jgi:hypothetical protein